MSIETMTKLATVTVGAGGTSAIEFTNIPQNYTDLKVVFSAQTNNDSWVSYVQFNGTTTNRSQVQLVTNASAVSSNSNASEIFISNSRNASSNLSFSSGEMYITNYSSSNPKSISIDSGSESNTTTSFTSLIAGLYNSALPITSIKFTDVGATIQQHSTATIYGIKAARTAVGGAIKATGGNISFDGTYVVHSFYSSGTFTPTAPLQVDYLVVAGGGGGGNGAGGVGAGGGGAGGYRAGSQSVISGNDYTVTIGAGGAGKTTDETVGNSGSNSIFGTITSTGGGGGGHGGDTASSGLTGGSGGGGGNNFGGGGQSGGSNTAGQGNSGGAGSPIAGAPFRGGGGGGAGAAGTAASRTTPGNGGAGIESYITGKPVTYAGGGGGATSGSFLPSGAGGAGGGGRGTNGNDLFAVAGTANTGGGGGGNLGFGYLSGAGGSGIVVIRYKA